MTRTKIIDGKKLADEILDSLKKEITELKTDPFFAVIKVGNNPASEVYIRHKFKVAEKIGIDGKRFDLPSDASQEELIKLVKKLNTDSKIDGILIQLPLPKHIDEKTILETINPKKDIDCLHPLNVGKLIIGNTSVLPCTPQGCLTAIKSVKKNLSGLNAVILGRSNIVGKPLVSLLLKENCTVTIAHSKSKDFTQFTKNADIVIVAVGTPKLLKASMIKDGAIVIDVGINRVNGKLVGDVDFENVKEKASAITPVPKGIGPLTIAFLMKNILKVHLNNKI